MVDTFGVLIVTLVAPPAQISDVILVIVRATFGSTHTSTDSGVPAHISAPPASVVYPVIV